MLHFEEGEKSEFINNEYEIAVSGDFSDVDPVAIRKIGETEPVVMYQANFLKMGVNL